MARATRVYNERGVREWFAGLSFAAQQAVVEEFAAVVHAAKAQRIRDLEEELRTLRSGATGARPRVSVAANARRGASPKKGRKVPPKYIDPASGKTWAGRGVRPAWVQQHLKKRGAALDDLLIEKPKGR